MINLTIDPNSHAITCLAEQVKSHRRESEHKEALSDSVSRVVNSHLKQNDALVEDLEKKQFKPGQDVSIDFYVNIRMADSRIISMLSQTLIAKLSVELQE